MLSSGPENAVFFGKVECPICILYENDRQIHVTIFFVGVKGASAQRGEDAEQSRKAHMLGVC
jgi:hypothetical protein